MNLIEIDNLSVEIGSKRETVHAVRGVSLTLREEEVLAIVGESGCGKSILCKSIMGLLPKNSRITGGHIYANQQEITRASQKELRRLRGDYYSMLFQDPISTLDPTYPIGKQISEAVERHQKELSRQEVKKRVMELMKLVGMPEPEVFSKLYPYNLSGGMRQRCVLAIALAGTPKVLIADEPTTALDVTIQAQILQLLRELQAKLHMSTILVSHDLSVVAQAADRVAIMYAGRIVEIGTVEEVFYDPRHPYTWALMRSLPYYAKGKDALYTLPGMPPSLVNPPKGDAFAERNEYALAIDYEEEPPMFQITPTHYAATWLLDERAPKVARPDFFIP